MDNLLAEIDNITSSNNMPLNAAAQQNAVSASASASSSNYSNIPNLPYDPNSASSSSSSSTSGGSAVSSTTPYLLPNVLISTRASSRKPSQRTPPPRSASSSEDHSGAFFNSPPLPSSLPPSYRNNSAPSAHNNNSFASSSPPQSSPLLYAVSQRLPSNDSSSPGIMSPPSSRPPSTRSKSPSNHQQQLHYHQQHQQLQQLNNINNIITGNMNTSTANHSSPFDPLNPSFTDFTPSPNTNISPAIQNRKRGASTTSSGTSVWDPSLQQLVPQSQSQFGSPPSFTTTTNTTGVAPNPTPPPPPIADPSLLSLLLSGALNDSRQYMVLSKDVYEDKCRELAVLSSQVSSLQNRLTLESRIRDAAVSLAKASAAAMNAHNGENSNAMGNPGGNAGSSLVDNKLAAEEQVKAANRKVDAIATELWKATGKLMECERLVIKHTAAVLRDCLLSGVATPVPAAVAGDATGSRKDSDPSSSISQHSQPSTQIPTQLQMQQDPRELLASTELKLRESEKTNAILQSALQRIEAETMIESNRVLEQVKADHKKQTAVLEKSVRKLEGELKALKNATLTSNISSSSSSSSSAATAVYTSSTTVSNVDMVEHNRLKLDLATTRADMAGLQEELLITKDSLTKAQLQLEEDLNGMEQKDRMISDLLAELEEVTNQFEMTLAANIARENLNFSNDNNTHNENHSKSEEAPAATSQLPSSPPP